jgi:hypothetical protein
MSTQSKPAVNMAEAMKAAATKTEAPKAETSKTTEVVVGQTPAEKLAEARGAHELDAVLGRIGFDEKGEVYGYEPPRVVASDGRQLCPGRTGRSGRLKPLELGEQR